MSFGISADIWLVLAAVVICTSFITSAISGLSKILVMLEKRGMDIEYKLHLLQHTINEIAKTVEGVESNTRP